MPISTIVSRGYGSYGGGINELPTRGYTPGTVIIHVTSTGFYRPAAEESAYERLAAVESAPTYSSRPESANVYPGKNDEQVQ